MSQCAALNCKSVTSEGCEKSFHLFPKDAAQRQCWLFQMKRENYWPSETTVLCSDHFEPEYFIRTGQTTRLMKDAVPTLFKTTPTNLKKLSMSTQPVFKGGLYKCNKCKYSTDKKPNWYKHRNKHLGLRRHSCTECNYKATTSSNLKRHLAIHADLREFKCPFCLNFFRQKIHLEKHILYKHEYKRSKLDLTKILNPDEFEKASSSKISSKDSSFLDVNFSHVKESQLNTDLFNQDRILKPIQIWKIPENSLPLSDSEQQELQCSQQEPQYPQQEPQCSQQESQYSEQEPQYSQQKPQYSQQESQYSGQEAQYSQQEPQYSQQEPQYSQQEPQYSQQEPQYSQQEPQYSQPEPQYSQQDDDVPSMVYIPPQFKKVHIVSEHQYHVMESLAQLWKKGKLCDAAIGNGSSILMVHKIVLLAVCPKLLSTIDTHYNQFLVVNLPQSVSSEALDAFAEYIYKGHLNLDAELLNQLKTIALCLEIDDLKQLCDSERGSSSCKVQPLKNKDSSDPVPDTITVTFYPPKKQLSPENQVNLSSSFFVSSHNQSVVKSQANVKIKKEMITCRARSTRFPSQKDLVEQSSTKVGSVLTAEVRDVYEHFQDNDLVATPTDICDEQSLRTCSKSASIDVGIQPCSYLPLDNQSQVQTDPSSSLHFDNDTANNFSEANQPKQPFKSAVKVEPVIIESDSEDSLLPSPSSTFMDSSHISSSRPIEDNLSEILTTNCSTALEDSVTNNHCQDSNNATGIHLSYEQHKFPHTTINTRHKGNSFLNSEIFRYNHQVERNFTSKEINSTLNEEIYNKEFR